MENKLLEKANNILQIAAMKNYYDKKICLINNPTSFNKAFLLKEMIVHLGKGIVSIDNLSKRCDEAEFKMNAAKDSLIYDDVNKDAKYEQLVQLIDEFKTCLIEVFDTFLQLYADGNFKGISDADFSQLFEGSAQVNKNRFMEVANSQLYQSFRSAMATGKFRIENTGLWPTADLSSKNRRLCATAYIRPDTLDMVNDEHLKEWQAIMSQKVMAMSDLTADVFDIIMGKWLKEAQNFEAMERCP